MDKTAHSLAFLIRERATTAVTTPLCRLCRAPLHRALLDLPGLPLVRICDGCGLAQTAEPVPSAAPHAEPARAQAEAVRARFHLGHDAITVHGSSRLDRFQIGKPDAMCISVPAFNTETAMDIAVRLGRADVVVADGVLPLAADIFDFAAGLACLLRTNGVLSLRFPSLLALVRDLRFDAFRPDVYTYLSLPVAERLLRSVGLRMFDVRTAPEDPTGLRVLACHNHSPRPPQLRLRQERQAAVPEPGLYEAFTRRAGAARADIQAFLNRKAADGRTLAAYGSAAIGAALFGACGITGGPIPCIAGLGDGPKPDDIIVLPGARDWGIRLQPARQAGVHLWALLPRIVRL